jgi:hypothetical protein
MLPTTNFEVTCDVGFAGGNVEQYTSVGMSVDGVVGSIVGIEPNAGYSVYFLPSYGQLHIDRINAGTLTNLTGDVAYTYTPGVRVNVDFIRAGSTITLYVWNVGSGKPGTPTWTGTDSSPYNAPMKAWLGNCNGATGTALSATFDNLVIDGAGYPFGVTTPSPSYR